MSTKKAKCPENPRLAMLTSWRAETAGQAEAPLCQTIWFGLPVSRLNARRSFLLPEIKGTEMPVALAAHQTWMGRKRGGKYIGFDCVRYLILLSDGVATQPRACHPGSVRFVSPIWHPPCRALADSRSFHHCSLQSVCVAETPAISGPH